MEPHLDFEPLPGLTGWSAAHIASTGSTNADLIGLLASGGAGSGQLWLTAGEQAAGRGRRERSWASPPSNLYASVVLVDPAPLASVGQLPLIAALAARDAIAGETGLDQRVQIKWPNDVLIDGAKCCGILLESRQTPDGRAGIVCGFGFNIASHPVDTLYPATHLQAHSPEASPATLFHRLADAFAKTLTVWSGGANMAAVRQRWLAHARGLGSPLTVNLSGAVFEGVFEAMDDDGGLVLRLADGTSKRFSAGDVFF